MTKLEMAKRIDENRVDYYMGLEKGTLSLLVALAPFVNHEDQLYALSKQPSKVLYEALDLFPSFTVREVDEYMAEL